MLTDLQAVSVLSFAPVIGKPYDGKRHVRFDEGALETEHGGTGTPTRNRKSGIGNPPPKQPRQCSTPQRENVVEYLSPKKRDHFRRKLQNAYEQPTYDKAKKKLGMIRKELQLINASAVKSLDEGLEETLTLHRLGLFHKLGESFKTTNCIENVNKQVCKYTDRVSRWQNSDQRQRWVGMALIEIEPRLNKVRGHKFLEQLRVAMRDTAINQNEQLVFAA